MRDRVKKIQPGGEPDPRRRPQPEEGSLAVLFEDDALLVLDKPAGVVVHPTYRNTSGTLLNAVLWRYRDRADARPGILTRLDKDTSGIVVIALTPVLHAAMQRQMHAGRVKKEYMALVRGTPDPPHGRITLPLGRSTTDRRLVVVREDGAPCETIYEIVDRGRRPSGEVFAVVCCQPVTGRTHQIRVHLAARGWPIIGDRVYGTPDASIARQALHASRVTFPHPITGQTMTIESPLPPDIAAMVQPG